MDQNNSWNNLGEEIRDAVELALRTGDFTQFGSTISTKVNDAVKSVSSSVEKTVAVNVQQRQNYTEQMANRTRERQRRQQEEEQQARIQREVAYRSAAPFRAVGRCTGLLAEILGWTGVGIFGPLSAVFLGLGIGMGGGFTVTFFIMIAFLIASILFIKNGIKVRRRYKRALKYLKLAGNNHYINIEDIAYMTEQSKTFVLNDVKKMLEKGYFPQGHLDKQKTCLMLDEKIFQEYIKIEKERRNLQKQQKKQAVTVETSEDPQKTDAQASNNPELDAMIAEGQQCIRELREMNDKIPGEEISAKLFKLENLLKEIFEKLKEHPEKLPQMQKFMNYYLPTTMKLVDAYAEFDNMSVQGQDIMDAKAEIEKTLDSINDAFVELLNRMLRDKAFDVATDAQVLQTMLAKEGLTSDNKFEKATQ